MIIISLFDMVKHSFDEIIKEKHRREKKVKYNCFNILEYSSVGPGNEPSLLNGGIYDKKYLFLSKNELILEKKFI